MDHELNFDFLLLWKARICCTFFEDQYWSKTFLGLCLYGQEDYFRCLLKQTKTCAISVLAFSSRDMKFVQFFRRYPRPLQWVKTMCANKRTFRVNKFLCNTCWLTKNIFRLLRSFSQNRGAKPTLRSTLHPSFRKKFCRFYTSKKKPFSVKVSGFIFYSRFFQSNRKQQ